MRSHPALRILLVAGMILAGGLRHVEADYFTATVNATADNTIADSYLTLREAILLINADGDAMTALGRSLTPEEAALFITTGTFTFVDFDASVFSSSQTITLGSPLPFSSPVAPLLVPNSGTTLTIDGELTGSSNLGLASFGTLVLDGTSTLTGVVDVIGGTLTINGSLASAQVTGAGNVNGSGSTGAGDLLGTVSNTPGSLTFASLNLQGGTLALAVGPAAPIVVTGALTMGGSFTHIDLTDAGATSGQTYTLMTFGSTDYAAADFVVTGVAGNLTVQSNALEFTPITPPQPVGPLAFVANCAIDTLSVIDTGTNATLPPMIRVGTMPNPSALSTDGATLYVGANDGGGSGTISILDTASRQVTATINPGGILMGLAVSPDGTRVYVTDFANDTVIVIDAASHAILTTIPLTAGDGPFGIAITPDGAFAYVANQTSGTVAVINTATNTVIAPSIIVSSGAEDVAITPDGSRAYITGSAITVIATATNIVIATIPTASDTNQIAIRPDGAIAYATSYPAGTVAPIDLATNTALTVIPVDSPQGVAFTSDGTRAYVTDYDTDTVTVLDTATNTVTGSPIPVGAGPYSIAIEPASAPIPTYGVAMSVAKGKKRATFTITNTGSTTTSFRLSRFRKITNSYRGPSPAQPGKSPIKIIYSLGGANVTKAIESGSAAITIAPGGRTQIVMKVMPRGGKTIHFKRTIRTALTATSLAVAGKTASARVTLVLRPTGK